MKGGMNSMEIRKRIVFKQIGAKIAYYRTLRGLKQEESAQHIGVSKSVLSRVERGQYNNNVSVSMLFDIAEALQIELALLVTFNDAEKKMWWDEIKLR